MPEGWKTETIENVCRLITSGGTPSRQRPEYFSDESSGIPWLKTQELRDRTVITTQEFISELGLKSSSAKLLPRNTVMLAMYGGGTVGDVAILGKEMTCNQASCAMVVKEDVMRPKYLFYWLIHNRDYVISLASGAAQQNLSARIVRQLKISFPPLPEQDRIVDLMASVDGAIDATSQTLASVRDSLGAFLDQADADESVQMDMLASMRSGPSWTSEQESPVPVEGSLPVLGITNTKSGGHLDLSDRRFVAGVPASAMRLREDSLIMIRTNGNRSRIGNVYRSVPEIVGHAVSAFQIAIQPLDPSMSPYIYWMLRAPKMQAMMSDAASGSTGLGNIAIGWLKNLALPRMESEEREDFVNLCESFHGVHEGLQSKLCSLKHLRSQLLASLLSGHHCIPSSYDDLLETSA
ncbi:restriction endonuclease subunit S [Arthrobacter sp. HMWF013]|uniref:restriction endonuclease subunit S n=1 Tax=Arthrobacter sp. HMWF013 TaxID=2056849 RepID=UPI000D3CBFE9|nr:restriction endonuclease subunit S [Arthrobacter sp. HMWF013]PTT69209.1 hypothetical protein DBR22_04365 [Arthrobacter sp. HMWF013]